MIKYLPLSISTQHLELLQQCVDPTPDGSNLSFKHKKIGAKTFWYLYVSIGNRRSEHYLGEETQALLEKINSQKGLWGTRSEDRALRSQLVAMLVAGGAASIGAAEGRVLALLEASGVFTTGAVLIGTFAFQSYANMLGVQWSSSLRTQDVDLAHELSLPLALSPKAQSIDLRASLLESGLGFIEVPTLDRKSPSTRFKLLGKELIVELLLPMLGANSSKPIKIPSLGTYGEPVRFLEYLLEDTQVAVLLYKYGISVRVPSPRAFAIHKLVVSQRRPPTFAAKSQKDIQQAEQLFEVLLEDRPGDLQLAIEAAHGMGDKFLNQLSSGCARMKKDLAEKINKMIFD